MNEFTVWALERIVNSLIGGAAIYLGYRLFITAPRTRAASAAGSARLQAPGSFSIYLSHIGPGVFFALFGASILAMSVYKGVTYRGPNDWSGFSSSAATGTSVPLTARQRTAMRKAAARNIAALNEVIPALRPGLDSGRMADIELAIPRIKLELMKPVWDADWGDEQTFAHWVEAGAVQPAPAAAAKAAAFFNSGAGGEAR